MPQQAQAFLLLTLLLLLVAAQRQQLAGADSPPPHIPPAHAADGAGGGAPSAPPAADDGQGAAANGGVDAGDAGPPFGPVSVTRAFAGLQRVGPALKDDFTQLRLRLINTVRPVVAALCEDCDCGAVCHHVYDHGIFAPVATTLLEHILSGSPPGRRVVVDVGANVGYFSLVAAAWGARVTAFEPNAPVAALMRLGVAMQSEPSLVRLLPYALGAEEGELHLEPHEEGWAYSRLVDAEAAAAAAAARQDGRGGGGGDAPAVRVVRLADYAPAGNITLLKVDVEGHEEQVLAGADGVLPRTEWLLLEAKRFDDEGGRAFLRRVAEEGGFTHVYCFVEEYNSGYYPVGDPEMVDVTGVVREGLALPLPAEDFVFGRRELRQPIAVRDRERQGDVGSEGEGGGEGGGSEQREELVEHDGAGGRKDEL